MRRGPQGSQNGGGPLAHATGASVAKAEEDPSPMRRGLGDLKTEGAPRPCGRGLGGPKVEGGPAPMRQGPQWSLCGGDPRAHAAGA